MPGLEGDVDPSLESPVMRAGWLRLVEAGAKIWRNNVGRAIQGKRHVVKASGPVSLNFGDIVIKAPRYVRFGLCEGSSDLIGYLPVTVTPDMVGRKLAVFVAAEAKSTTGKETDHQADYLRTVREDGGIAFAFRTEAEALQQLRLPL